MRKKTKTKPAESLYKVSVKNLGKFYKSDGATLVEAVSKIEIPNPKGFSLWKVEHEGKTREKVVMPFITTNLFNTRGVAHEIALKKFVILFS